MGLHRSLDGELKALLVVGLERLLGHVHSGVFRGGGDPAYLEVRRGLLDGDLGLEEVRKWVSGQNPRRWRLMAR